MLRLGSRASLALGIIVLVSVGVSCGGRETDSEDGDVTAGCKGASHFAGWRDLGAVPATTVRRLTVLSGRVFAATEDGIYARPLDGSEDWKRSGLDGMEVGIVYAPNPTKHTLLASLFQTEDSTKPQSEPPLWRSSDRGETWKPVGDFRDEALSTPGAPVYEVITDIVAVPGTDDRTLLVNANATNVFRSSDRGLTWTLAVGERGAFGYGCLLAVPAAAPNMLFQGCEIPLDSAWVGSYDLKSKPVGDSFSMLVDWDTIGNKRPNSVVSFLWTKKSVYAGLEGGLVRLEPGAPAKTKWIFRHDGEQGEGAFPYTYVQHVWVDPCDSKHVVFGGWDKAEGEHAMQLYETFDEGKKIELVPPPELLDGDSFALRHGVAIGDGSRDLLLAVDVQRRSETRGRVLIRQHGPR